MLLGFARGSVGDLTFYRRNAQQITRARSRVVKNPKTLAQQMQRAIMRTAVDAYGVLKGICDHSYEGVAYGADSYAKFLKLNLDMLRSLAAAGGANTKSFVPSGYNGLVAMPWVLSKGSISWGGVNNSPQDGAYWYFNKSIATSDILSITYAQFCEVMGLQQGDQLTFIWAPKREDIDESTALEIKVARIILSPAQGEFSETQLFVRDREGSVNAIINDANPLNENDEGLRFMLNEGQLFASTRIDDPDEEYIGVGLIVSRRASDGSWLRSPETFLYNEGQREGGYTLRQASMVVSNDIVTPSDWYLNNANEGSGE